MTEHLFPFPDQRGRTAAPRNNNVGPPVLPNHSGVSHKFPGTLPPNLVTNGKGKGKERKTATLPFEEDELLAHVISMSLEGEEGEDDQEYYGAGQEFNVFTSEGAASSATLPPPNPVTNGKEKGKERIAVMLPLEEDELLAHTIAMGLEGEEGEDDYGAGLGLDFFAPEGTASSATLPPPDLRDPIDHTGVGVHVDGVSAKPVVVEDSLWGDPLEERNKKNKSKDKKEEDLLCDYHGKVCSRGICKVYEKQLREQRKLREAKESQNWRGGNGGPNNGRGGRGGRGIPRGRGIPLRGKGGLGRDFGPRSPRDGEFHYTDFFLASRLNHLFSQKTRPRGGPTASSPLKMRGPNPTEIPKVILLGVPTTTRGVQARWMGLQNPSKNPILAQAQKMIPVTTVVLGKRPWRRVGLRAR